MASKLQAIELLESTIERFFMKFALAMLAIVITSSAWAVQYKSCTSKIVTIQISDNQDKETLALGINANIIIIQNRGGVTLPVMARESTTGNKTTYESPMDFKLVVSHALGKMKNFSGETTINGRKINVICN